MADQTLLLTVEEAARLCRIGKTKMYEMVATGEIRSLTIGKCRRIPRAWLEQWINDQLAEQEEKLAS